MGPCSTHLGFILTHTGVIALLCLPLRRQRRRKGGKEKEEEVKKKSRMKKSLSIPHVSAWQHNAIWLGFPGQIKYRNLTLAWLLALHICQQAEFAPKRWWGTHDRSQQACSGKFQAAPVQLLSHHGCCFTMHTSVCVTELWCRPRNSACVHVDSHFELKKPLKLGRCD